VRLGPGDKQAQIQRRIGAITRFDSQDPNKDFLFLDYSPDSADAQALDFDDFREDQQRKVLRRTPESCRREYPTDSTEGCSQKKD
jgi:hypothetical protein